MSGVCSRASFAEIAAELGAGGIVVSNSGGRQLNGVLSTTLALPPVADVVGDRLVVLADGGFRSGLDVLRLVGIGSPGCPARRAWVHALAGGGGAGVMHMLKLVEADLRVAVVLTAAPTNGTVSRRSLAPFPTIRKDWITRKIHDGKRRLIYDQFA